MILEICQELFRKRVHYCVSCFSFYIILFEKRRMNQIEKFAKELDKILLSVVLPRRSYIVKKGREKFDQDCESDFHSHISPESKEIVLFQSAQILPLFIIRFKRIPNATIIEEPCD